MKKPKYYIIQSHTTLECKVKRRFWFGLSVTIKKSLSYGRAIETIKLLKYNDRAKDIGIDIKAKI